MSLVNTWIDLGCWEQVRLKPRIPPCTKTPAANEHSPRPGLAAREAASFGSFLNNGRASAVVMRGSPKRCAAKVSGALQARCTLATLELRTSTGQSGRSPAGSGSPASWFKSMPCCSRKESKAVKATHKRIPQPFRFCNVGPPALRPGV